MQYICNTKHKGNGHNDSTIRLSILTHYGMRRRVHVLRSTGIILGIEYLYRSTFSGLYCYRVTFAQHFDQVLISDELQKIAEAFAKEVNRVEDWQEEVIEN